MPVHRSSRRAGCAKPKYTFSDDEDEDSSQTTTDDSNSSFIAPPDSALPLTRSSHTRKRPATYIRRPRNAFIIFRSEFCEQQKMKESGIESDHRHISRIAAHVWNNLSENNKEVYQERARAESEAHKAAFPDYRYTPVGRPKNGKRIFKRDGTKDKVRCRQLAELLISGVEGEEFQQAAKGLDDGVVKVELTPRTSHPAPRRPRRDRHQPSRTPSASQDGISTQTDIQEDSQAQALNLGLSPSLPSSPSNDAFTASPGVEQELGIIHSDLSTASLSFPPVDWEPEPTQVSDWLSTYYVPMDNVPPLQPLSDDLNLEQLSLSAPSNHTFAGFDLQVPALRTSDSPEVPQSLPYCIFPEEATNISWPTPSTIGPSRSPSLSATPSLQPSSPSRSVEHGEGSDAAFECSPSPAPFSIDNPWKLSANTEVFFMQTADGLSVCYPSEADLEEYLLDV